MDLEGAQAAYKAKEYSLVLQILEQAKSTMLPCNYTSPHEPINLLDPRLIYIGAKSYMHLNNKVEAQAYFEMIVDQLPFGPSYQLGRLAKLHQKFHQALHSFHRALREAPTPFKQMKAYCQAGSCYILVKDYTKARECFLTARQSLNGGYLAGCLAWTYIKLGQYDLASEELRCIDANDASELTWRLKYILAVCLTHRGQYHEALELMHSLISHDKTDYRYWCSCGVIYAKCNHNKDAFHCFFKGFQEHTQSWEVLYNLGLLYEANSRFAEADHAFKLAHSANPDSLAHFRIGARLPLSEHIHPEFDIADFILASAPNELHPTEVSMEPVTEVETIEVSGISVNSDDKHVPSYVLVGLPLSVPAEAGISLEFMQGLVKFCQKIAKKKMSPGEVEVQLARRNN